MNPPPLRRIQRDCCPGSLRLGLFELDEWVVEADCVVAGVRVGLFLRGDSLGRRGWKHFGDFDGSEWGHRSAGYGFGDEYGYGDPADGRYRRQGILFVPCFACGPLRTGD